MSLSKPRGRLVLSNAHGGLLLGDGPVAVLQDQQVQKEPPAPAPLRADCCIFPLFQKAFPKREALPEEGRNGDSPAAALDAAAALDSASALDAAAVLDAAATLDASPRETQPEADREKVLDAV